MIGSETHIVHSEGEVDKGALIGFELQVAADEPSRQLAIAIEAETGLDLGDLAKLVLMQERRSAMSDGGRTVRAPGVRPRSERHRYTPLALSPKTPTPLVK